MAEFADQPDGLALEAAVGPHGGQVLYVYASAGTDEPRWVVGAPGARLMASHGTGDLGRWRIQRFSDLRTDEVSLEDLVAAVPEAAEWATAAHQRVIDWLAKQPESARVQSRARELAAELASVADSKENDWARASRERDWVGRLKEAFDRLAEGTDARLTAQIGLVRNAAEAMEALRQLTEERTDAARVALAELADRFGAEVLAPVGVRGASTDEIALDGSGEVRSGLVSRDDGIIVIELHDLPASWNGHELAIVLPQALDAPVEWPTAVTGLVRAGVRHRNAEVSLQLSSHEAFDAAQSFGVMLVLPPAK